MCRIALWKRIFICFLKVNYIYHDTRIVKEGMLEKTDQKIAKGNKLRRKMPIECKVNVERLYKMSSRN